MTPTTDHLNRQSIALEKPFKNVANSIVSNLKISNFIASLTQEISEFSFEPVLGTSLDITIRATKGVAETASEAALNEIDRLEKIYSRFDSSSELNLWLSQEGTVNNVSSDLVSLVNKALMWTAFTKGAFHPGVDALSQLWFQAEEQNVLPTLEEIAVRLELTSTPFATSDTLANNLTKHYPNNLNFNALAKGLIVDKTIEATLKQTGVKECLLNIGGDLKHYSYLKESKGVLVNVENPFTCANNLAPHLTLNIKNQAVATSGASHRGFKILDNHYSHIIDPRTGWPVADTVSATVIAPSCATADVLATAFTVLSFEDSLALAQRLPNVGCYLVTASGESISNTFFDNHIT